MTRSLREYLYNSSKLFPAGYDARVERFVADFGEEFAGSKRPIGLRKGKAKLCFYHAADLAGGDDRYEYVEGYARGKGPLPFLHAWCLFEGRVVDRTLKDPENHEYIGVRIPTRLLNDILAKQKRYGVLFGTASEEFTREWSKSHIPFNEISS